MEQDTRAANLALAAVAAQFFVNGSMTGSFLARAPQIRDRIGVTLDQYGMLLATAALFGLLGSLLAGRIVHRTSTRWTLRLGALVMVATLPLIGLADSPALWLVAMGTYQFCDVLVDIAMNLQGSWISARRHRPVLHRLHGLWSLGTLTGGFAAAAANRAGMSILVHLSLVATAMAFVLIFVARHVLDDDERGHGEAAAPPDRSVRQPSTAEPPLRPPRGPVLLLVAAGMLAVAAEMTGGDWASFRLTDDFGAKAAVGSLAFVAFTVGMTATRFGGDALHHRLGGTVLHRLSVGIALSGFVIASLVPHQAAALAGFALAGMGVSTFMPKLYDEAARLPGRRGGGVGAMAGGMRVMFLITPVAVGGLAGSSFSVGSAIALVAVPAVIGVFVVTQWSHHLLNRVPAQRW